MNKKIITVAIVTSMLGTIFSAGVFAQTNGSTQVGVDTIAPDQVTGVSPVVSSDELLQLENLTVQGISQTSTGWEITAGFSYLIQGILNNHGGGAYPMSAPPAAMSAKCRGFANKNDSMGTPITCPAPPAPLTLPIPPPSASSRTSSTGTGVAPSLHSTITISSYPTMPQPYRIEVDASTHLLLRDRTGATITDFTAGDTINVYGFYNTDGTVRSLIVRNLSKPVETTFIQLNNVNLISVVGALPNATLIVAQQDSYPCLSYGANGTAAPFRYPCPYGLDDSSPTVGSVTVPQSMAMIWPLARKYKIQVDANTILLNRLRGQISLSELKAGQTLNIYGETTGNGVVNADLVRDLDTPPIATVSNGTITQVNFDGSFVMQLDDGSTVTVQNPNAVGARVQITGILDRVQNIISQVSQIIFGNNNPIPTPLPMLRIQGAPGSAGGTPNSSLR